MRCHLQCNKSRPSIMDEQKALLFAMRNLLAPMENLSESMDMMFDTKLDEEYALLQEMYETACEAFTVKSKHLQPMPKTPSVKNKRQARKRKQDAQRSDEESTPELSRKKPSKLTFNDTEHVEETTEDADFTTGRPMRSCRASKKVTKATKTCGKQKRVSREAKESAPVKNAVSPKPSNISSVVPGNADTDEAEKKAEPADTKISTPQISLKANDAEGSPSVKARAKAYEVMLESLTPNNQQGTKLTEAQTASTPKSNQTLESPRVVVSKSSSLEKRSMKSRQSQRALEKETSGSPPAKPIRTRLRLNKQNTNESKKDDCVSVEAKTQEMLETKPDNKTTATVPCHTPNSEYGRDHKKVVNSPHENKPPVVPGKKISLSETQVEISEVFEICGPHKEAKLQHYEVVKTKTTPIINPAKLTSVEPATSDDQGFTSGDKGVSDSSDSDIDEVINRVTSHEMEETSAGMSTRTKTRTKANTANAPCPKAGEDKDSGVGICVSSEKANSLCTKDNSSGSDEGVTRSTRTRARAQKEEAQAASDTGNNIPPEDEPVRHTRTRQRLQEAEAAKAKVSSADKKQVSQKAAEKLNAHEGQRELNSARGFAPHTGDERLAGSPSVRSPRSLLRGAKRLVDHGRGLSPAPKRARSILGEELAGAQPLSTSSPAKSHGENEARDMVQSPVRKNNQPFKFNSAQRNTSGFLNRTPGFSHNTSKMLSFINTPKQFGLILGSGPTKSFLTKATPSPQQNSQLLIEERKKKLLEKQRRDSEKVNRQKEMKKRKLEEKKRERAERFQRVAAQRQEKEEKLRQMGEQVKKKLGNSAAVKAKILEEREKEEAEKQKQRYLKQLEADQRRKQEEEEKQRKRLEQEAEARLQEELLKKKRLQEEAMRKQKIAEENKRKEERLAEKEQRQKEERIKFLEAQREKDLVMEKLKLERENQLRQERVERERAEKEKKLEKERKLREEMHKLKVMEQERLHLKEQELQKEKEAAAKDRELKQMINKHNKSVMACKQQCALVTNAPAVPASTILNTTQTLNTSKGHNPTDKSNSYEMTPAKKPVVSKNCNPQDYGLDDKDSDDSTDDDEAPKKKIPDWATGLLLSTALIKQVTNPPDLDAIFRPNLLVPPDLEIIFRGQRKRRYKERTSSAIWNTPPLKYC